MPWSSPTSFIDNGGWSGANAPNTYDGDTGTGCICGVGALNTYQGTLELHREAVIGSKLRYYISAAIGTPTIDIDVYYSGAWHNLLEAAPIVGSWTEVSYGGSYSVTAMRINFKNAEWHTLELAEVELENESTFLPRVILS